MANNIVGAEGLTANPGLIDRQRNDVLLQQAIENAAREREFQAKYELEQRQMADAQMARQQQASLEAQRMSRADQANSLAQAWEQQKFAAEQQNAEKARQNELAKEQMGYTKAIDLERMKQENSGRIDPLDRAKLDVEIAKIGQTNRSDARAEAMTKKEQDKRGYELLEALNTVQSTNETNKMAMDALNKIESGYGGKLELAAKQVLDPNNPYFGEWQKVKTAIADAQLQYSTMLKGPTSDKDMMFLSEAVANNDLMQLPRIKAALDFHNRNVAYQAKKQQEGFAQAYGRDALGKVLSEFGYEDSTGGRAQTAPKKDNFISSLREKYGKNGFQ